MSKIAVVGMSCLFPKAFSTEAFWEVLKNGQDCRTDATSKDFGLDVDNVYSPEPGANKIYCLKGGFIRDFEFDSSGFQLDSPFLQELDDVFQWSLHVTRNALRDANLWNTSHLKKTGIIMGNYAFPTRLSNRQALPIWYKAIREHLSEHLKKDLPPLPEEGNIPHAFNRYVCGLPASVVASACGMQGPSYSIDAACSSALYAIKMSSYYLNSGKVDVMLAGGVCAPDPWLIHTSFSDLRAYPENGISQPFAESSTGIQTGQGAGMVVLKRLEDALADGDKIYCTIEGLGLSNDGAGKHLLSPNPLGQKEAYKRAYAEAEIPPSNIDYIECHATGTPLGDQTEMNSLEAYFGSAMDQIKLGSVKGMTGHLLTVAGLTSLIKLILSLQHQTLVPTSTLGGMNSRRSQSGKVGEHALLMEEQAWHAGDKTRYAGVSAFGFGGTNAHLVLSDRNVEAKHKIKTSEPLQVMPTSIVGMGAHFGPCDDLKTFEKYLFEGEKGLRPIGKEEKLALVQNLEGLSGYVESVSIDPLAFRIPPAELKHFSQQQLLMLKVADETLRDAGLERHFEEPRNISVILVLELDIVSHLRRAKGELPKYLKKLLASVGMGPQECDFGELLKSCGDALHHNIEPNEVLSYIGNIMASRISSLWNLTGASFTLSSDGRGVHQALETAQLMLAAKETEGVLIGAVDLNCVPEESQLNDKLSASGRSTLHAELGFAPGDGAGAIYIMREDDAKTQNCRRYAIIDNTFENAKNKTVGLVELTGTLKEKTFSENLSEIKALADGAALCTLMGRMGYSRIASPIAGIIASALSLYHRYIPAQNKGNKIFNKALQSSTDDKNFYRPVVSYPWFKPADGERRALVSNVSMLGELSNIAFTEADWPDAWQIVQQELNIIPIVAKTKDELVASIDNLIRSFSNDTNRAELEKVCRDGWFSYSSAKQVKDQSLAAAIIANNEKSFLREIEQLKKHLLSQNSKDWKTPAGSFFTENPKRGEIAFVYPGGFNSYPYLSNGLFRIFPEMFKSFESMVDDVGLAMSQKWIFPRSIKPLRSRDLMAMEQEMLQDIPSMLTNGTSLALLYTKILRDQFNVTPQTAFGYSLGESSMLFANGIWPAKGRSYDQLAKSPLFKSVLSGKRQLIRDAWSLDPNTPDTEVWASYVLMTSVEKVKAAIEQFDRVYITHININKEVLVAGYPTQVNDLIRQLGCESIQTPTAHVLHAEAMRGAQQDLAELNSFPSRRPIGDVNIISAGHYGVLDVFEQAHISALNSDSLCREVDFPRLMDKAWGLGARVFIEVGPGGTCSRWVDNHLSPRGAISFGCTQRGKNDLASFQQLLARLVSLQELSDVSSMFADTECKYSARTINIPFLSNTSLPEFKEPKKTLVTQSKAKAKADAQSITQNIENKHSELAVPEHSQGAASLPVRPLVQENAEKNIFYWNFNRIRSIIKITDKKMSVAAASQPQRVATPVVPPVSSASPVSTEAKSFSKRNPCMNIIPEKSDSQNTSLSIDAVIKNNIKNMAEAQQCYVASQHQICQLVFEELQSQVAPGNAIHSEALALKTLDYSISENVAELKQALSVQETFVQPLAPTQTVALEQSEVEATPGLVMNEIQLMAFANGRISDAFGEEYAEIDQYSVRVRLPSPPYFFVSRVTRLDAERGKYEPCMLTTEYDVPEDAWYLVDDVMPPGVAVEAGQSDLLLISYLGIDFENKGERMYRLLDGKLRFVGDLPRAGQTLRFDIHINSYVRQGGVLLFFFSYEGYVDGELALVLERGCAGFFTQEQLGQGQGMVSHSRDSAALHVKPILKHGKSSLSREDLAALSRGELESVFGVQSNPAKSTGVKLPPEQILMVDRVSVLNKPLDSGYIGIEAYKKLDPQGWYFESHFMDDPVLPGSLVAEGATQVLKIHMMSLGLQQCFPNAEFQPIPELLMDIKVRGQITPEIKELRYGVQVFETGYLPRPFVKADVIIYDGDRPLVAVENLGLCLKEKPGASVYPRYGEQAYFSGRRLMDGSPVVLNEFHLAHAAKGDLMTAMGKEFGVYGPDHRAPYIPNGDFQFVDRAIHLTGDRGEYQTGSIMVTEYDVPQDSWYFQQNSYPAMPNCVYLESALQASILLGYFLGVTLDFPDKELSIRNLDGKATYLNDIDLRGKTIRHKETLLSTSTLNGSILQNFRFELTTDGVPIYEGESLFGYFPEEALSNQLGIDNGEDSQFWFETAKDEQYIELALENEKDNPLFNIDPQKPHYRLASQQLNLLHKARLCENGGKYGKGYVYGYREIRESDWYFKCHFHRDPVMPGSLGLEAFVQAMQVYAMKVGIGLDKFKSPRFGIATDVETEWRYRGQLLMTDPDMNIEIHIQEIREEDNRIAIIADADLFKDKLRIYHVDKMAIAITEGDV